MKKSTLAFCSVVGLLSSQVFAGTMGVVQEDKRLYVRADIGGSFFNDPRVTTAAANNLPMTSPNSKITNSMLYNAGVGYKFLPNLRGDVTFSWRPNMSVSVMNNVPEVGKGDLRNYTLMGNAYFDINYFNLPVTPYVMAGLGLSSHYSVKNMFWPVSRRSEERAFFQDPVWQAGAGISYAFDANWSVDLGYQYAELGWPAYSGHYNVPAAGCSPAVTNSCSLVGAPTKWGDLNANQVQLGVRYYV